MASETKGEEENGDCIILTINNKKDIPIKIGGVHFWCVFVPKDYDFQKNNNRFPDDAHTQILKVIKESNSSCQLYLDRSKSIHGISFSDYDIYLKIRIDNFFDYYLSYDFFLNSLNGDKKRLNKIDTIKPYHISYIYADEFDEKFIKIYTNTEGLVQFNDIVSESNKDSKCSFNFKFHLSDLNIDSDPLYIKHNDYDINFDTDGFKNLVYELDTFDNLEILRETRLQNYEKYIVIHNKLKEKEEKERIKKEAEFKLFTENISIQNKKTLKQKIKKMFYRLCFKFCCCWRKKIQ